mmetsp:Transcript_9445/g.28393  ORF Transcript_9445/g.28393 Transcript_9445/m.28393 type:complete len:414 (-) Transcript_9445:2638-3879(-)
MYHGMDTPASSFEASGRKLDSNRTSRLSVTLANKTMSAVNDDYPATPSLPASGQRRKSMTPRERDRLARVALGLPARPVDIRDHPDPWGRRRRNSYRGNLRTRVISKVLSYGAFFLLFKLYRNKHPQKSGGHFSANTLGGHMGGQKKGEMYPTFFARLRKIFGISMNYKIGDVDSTISSPLPGNVQSFRAGPNAADVFLTHNTLDDEVVKRWRGALAYEWRRQLQPPTQSGEAGNGDNAGYPPETLGAWSFVTSPSRSDSRGYSDSIHFRNKTAHEAWKARVSPAFARWELDSGHPLWKEIETTFLSQKVINRFRPIAAGKEDWSKLVLDISVEHYGPGDFFFSGVLLQSSLVVGEKLPRETAQQESGSYYRFWFFLLMLMIMAIHRLVVLEKVVYQLDSSVNLMMACANLSN